MSAGLLDTSVVIDWYDPDVRVALPDELAISAVTAAELAAGPLLAANPIEAAKRQSRLQEVEARFAAHGFTVVRPEEHPMSEQVALFRAAEVVAGYAGSAMFTLAMCPEPTRVISLAPDAYTGRNEYGIASLWGHRLTSVWSASEVRHPPGGWTREAFWAPFSFDFDDEGRFLEAVIAGLDR